MRPVHSFWLLSGLIANAAAAQVQLSLAEQYFVLKQAKQTVTVLDTDQDGIPNHLDPDDDNDGVPDEQDAFPLDPTEWLDTDGDGIGNNADPDDDNDGVPDASDDLPLDPTESRDQDGDGIGDNRDQFDLDAFCWRQQDGDSNGCYLSQIKNLNIDLLKPNPYEPNWVRQVDSDLQQSIVFIDQQRSTVYRFDVNSKILTLKEKLQLPQHLLLSFRYVAAHKKFYLLAKGSRQLFSLTADSSAVFQEPDLPVAAETLTDAGRFFIIRQTDGKLQLFDANGAFGAAKDNEHQYFKPGVSYSYIPALQQLFSGGQEKPRLSINQQTGEITTVVSSHDYRSLTGPISVSAHGGRLITGSGDVFDANSLSWQNNFGDGSAGQLWLPNDDLVQLHTYQSREADASFKDIVTLTRKNAKGGVEEALSWPGTAKLLLPAADVQLVLYQTDGQLQPKYYRASDDTDRDGVPNALDAFPNDAAASKDTDFDGAPDGWNPGMTQAQSTTGLIQDAFPTQAACQQMSDSNASGQCDLAKFHQSLDWSQPASRFFHNGILYLFSSEQQRVFRWSAETQQMLDPLVIRDKYQHPALKPGAQHLLLHPSHQKFYLHYLSGQVYSLPLTGGLPSFFAGSGSAPITNDSLRPLMYAGAYLLMQERGSEQHWTRLHSFTSDGQLAGTTRGNNSFGAVWSEHRQMLVYAKYDAGKHVQFTAMDSNGQFTYAGYDSKWDLWDYSQLPTLFLADDESAVLTNTGYLIKLGTTRTLIRLQNVNPISQAMWSGNHLWLAADNNLVILNRQSLEQLSSRTLPGPIVQLYGHKNQHFALYQNGQELVVTEIELPAFGQATSAAQLSVRPSQG